MFYLYTGSVPGIYKTEIIDFLTPSIIQPARKLQVLTVRKMDNDDCPPLWKQKPISRSTEDKLCAGPLEDVIAQDACPGDSGGRLS